MTIFDFYLMCDNIDRNWSLDIRKNGKLICKTNFYNLPPTYRTCKIEFFKLNQESQTCIIGLNA